MTEDQFQVLRQELSGLRTDIEERFTSLRAEMDRRFDGVETRIKGVEEGVIRLDAWLENKPDKAYDHQTLLTINASFIAVVGLAFLILRTFTVT
jgi:hypothetical protein